MREVDAVDRLVGVKTEVRNTEEEIVKKFNEFLRIWKEKTMIFSNSDELIGLFSRDYPHHYDWVEIFYIQYGSDEVISVVKDEHRRDHGGNKTLSEIQGWIALEMTKSLPKTLEHQIELIKKYQLKDCQEALDWLNKVVNIT